MQAADDASRPGCNTPEAWNLNAYGWEAFGKSSTTIAAAG